MKVTYSKGLPKADAYMFLCFEDGKKPETRLKEIQKMLGVKFQKESIEDFHGKDTESDLLYADGKRIIISGVGKKEDCTLEKLRRACARGIRIAGNLKVDTVAIQLFDEEFNSCSFEDAAIAQSESCIMRLYRFDKYYTSKEYEKIDLKELIFFAPKDSKHHKEFAEGIKTGHILGESTNLARDLGNEPSNVAYPKWVADFIKKRGTKLGYSVKVYGRKDLEKMNAGLILGVAQGSIYEPQFVVMEYKNGGAKDKPVVFVGKGVTFDSGGISIKPAGGMDQMKMDMCGAASVIGAFDAAARLKLKVNLIGLIPLVENMPSGTSFRPGDILTGMNGLNVEVQNTDAEGRLILGDALAYAERYKPSYVIDLATLTGAAVIALGHYATIAVSNDDSLTRKLMKAGEKTYERVWELPSWDEYDRLIDSDVADITNVGKGRQAGSIVAGMFLKRFVKGYKWTHLDIAGTAMNNKAEHYIPAQATGVGVRLLIEFLRDDLRK
jgi:leucyl aminopeptidase